VWGGDGEAVRAGKIGPNRRKLMDPEPSQRGKWVLSAPFPTSQTRRVQRAGRTVRGDKFVYHKDHEMRSERGDAF